MEKSEKFYRTVWFYVSVFLLLPGLLVQTSFAQQTLDRPALSQSYPLKILEQIIIDRENWHPFPTADDRGPWMSLPDAIRKYHIEQGEKAKKESWPALPATLFLEYVRTGNRSNYQGPFFTRRKILREMVIAECIEGKGRFTDAIADALWSICEESSWALPPHISGQKRGRTLPDVKDPIVALFSAETAAFLSWSVYLLGNQLDEVSPFINLRVREEVDSRILSPYLERNFWWSNVSMNWNPWCNSNCLTAALILEKDRSRRIKIVSKALKSLDKFIGNYPSDGGCDEGPGYWNVAAGALFDCLELLYSATGDKINVYDQPLIQQMGRYIYRVHIDEKYFVNFADASPVTTPAAGMIFQFGTRIKDKNLMAFGAYFAAKQRTKTPSIPAKNIGRQLRDFFSKPDLYTAVSTRPPLLKDVWLSEIQVMAARCRQSTSKGFYLAAKAGHNNESHNHNDVGNFIVYADGRPVLIDVGVGAYTAKTFSKNRYDIWTMQSAYHNLPTIDGIMQKNGRDFAARNVKYTSSGSLAQLNLDIAGAYPPSAGLDNWIRSIRLNRGHDVQIIDSYKFKKSPKRLTLNLMTCCEATIDKPGLLTLKNPAANHQPQVVVHIHYDADKLTAEIEKVISDDPKIKKMWPSLTRILLHVDNPKLQNTLNLRITR